MLSVSWTIFIAIPPVFESCPHQRDTGQRVRLLEGKVRNWDSTHPVYFLLITSFAVFPAVR
jgi:hypothetical protein